MASQAVTQKARWPAVAGELPAPTAGSPGASLLPAPLAHSGVAEPVAGPGRLQGWLCQHRSSGPQQAMILPHGLRAWLPFFPWSLGGRPYLGVLFCSQCDSLDTSGLLPGLLYLPQVGQKCVDALLFRNSPSVTK